MEVNLGSVFRRERGDARARNWYVEFSFNGKRIRKKARGARTKSEAKAYLRNIERETDRDEYTPGKRKEALFEVFAESYLKWAETNKLSWKRDRIFLSHLVPFFRGKTMNGITPLLIEDYKRKRKEKVSGSTVNRELACLKHMFNMAMDEGMARENPVRKVRFFREQGRKERILTDREKEELMKKCEGYLKAAVIVALNTGMRRGEILGLRWSRVDFTRNVITVERTKSGKPRRVPMNSLAESTLRSMRENRENGEYVFWNRKTGKAMKNVKKSFRKACERAAIANLRFHDLRHTFATELAEKGVDIATVCELLGHSSIVLTKRYSHPSPKHKREAVEILVGAGRRETSGMLPGLLTDECPARLTN